MDTDRIQDGLDDLLHQAQQLTANMQRANTDMLPRVERNFTQLHDATSKLAYRGPYSQTSRAESTDVKASLLLGSRGFDVQKASQRLEGLSTSKTFEPLEPVRETDIQGFLKNERENALLAAIEQARNETMDETMRRHWDSMESEWEREKQKLLTSLVDSTSDVMLLHGTPEPHGMITDSMSVQGRSGLDSTEMAYSKQVYIYNEKVVQGGVRPNLVDMFIQVVSRLDNQNVCDLWSVVQHMVSVPHMMSSDVAKVRTSTEMQAAFVKQALLYLEKSYVKYIERVIYGNQKQAELGGVPGTLNIVRSFLNVRPPAVNNAEIIEGGSFNGHPIWAVIYYCLRCGDVQAAMQVVSQSRQVLGEFPKYFEEYATRENRRLGSSFEAEIKLQYRRSIHSSLDPFKRAVYCVVGRCDPREDHAEAAVSTDDYLWLKLRQISVDDEDSKKPDKLTLTQFQTMLLEEYGETHFSAYQQPYLYFRVLFLTAQFEPAVEFLFRAGDALRCCAVHVAVVLHEDGLLLSASNVHALLLSKETGDPAHLRRINFVRLIMMYTRKFEVTDPREALEYFYFLRDIKTPQGENVFNSSVSELILETREFDVMLGRLQGDQTRQPGAVDKFKVDMKTLLGHIASEAEKKGLTEDAVRLYDLASSSEKVVELLNKLLCQVLSHPPSDRSNKTRIKDLAINIATRYKSQNIDVSRSARMTFHLQLDLISFFDLYHSGQHERAYNLIRELNLLPFSSDVVQQKVESFRSYTDEIRQNVPDILIAAMSTLLTKYRSIKGVGSIPDGVQSPLVCRPTTYDPTNTSTATTRPAIDVTHLRAEAQALIMFAGMIPYRMPGDTNSRLVQLEVQMH